MCSVIFVFAIAAGRRVVASVALAAWVGLAIALLMLFRESRLTSHSERGWFGLAVVAIAGLAAIVFRFPRAHRHPHS